MLRFVVVCGVAAISAVVAAQAVVSLDKQGGGTAMAAVAAPSLREAETPEPAPKPSHTAQIAKAKDGHYWADANVNGRRVKFLVDTGATAVALSTADAKRLGYDPSSLSYGYKVMTASGETRAARVVLDSVSVAGARVSDVEAYVIESGMTTSLLGMTYLGRLERFEATQTALILRP